MVRKPFLIDIRKNPNATNEEAKARYMGASKEEPGRIWTMSKARRGPVNIESDIDEFNRPAAVARSLFLYSIDLNDPT